ncbi:hypothetical protein AB0J42_21540 [Nonomuraea sp. NPDC049649]|uniref:hypothetical protein n=1 Tax=Nonomuraea sp. NPDC049649 TaxID=3155776 RepID=UPI003416C8D6
MSVPLWNVGGDVLSETGTAIAPSTAAAASVARAPAGPTASPGTSRAGHGRPIAA